MSTPKFSHRGITMNRVANGWWDIDGVTLTADVDHPHRVRHEITTYSTFGIEATRQRINHILDNLGGRPSVSGKIIYNMTELPIERALSLAGPFTVVGQ